MIIIIKEIKGDCGVRSKFLHWDIISGLARYMQ